MNNPVMLGRTMGLAVVGVAIAVAAVSVSDSAGSIGFLVLMTAERLNAQRGR